MPSWYRDWSGNTGLGLARGRGRDAPPQPRGAAPGVRACPGALGPTLQATGLARGAGRGGMGAAGGGGCGRSLQAARVGCTFKCEVNPWVRRGSQGLAPPGPEDPAGPPPPPPRHPRPATEPLSPRGGRGLLAGPGRPGFSEDLWIDTGSFRKKIKLKKAACHARGDQGLGAEGGPAQPGRAAAAPASHPDRAQLWAPRAATDVKARSGGWERGTKAPLTGWQRRALVGRGAAATRCKKMSKFP